MIACVLCTKLKLWWNWPLRLQLQILCCWCLYRLAFSSRLWDSCCAFERDREREWGKNWAGYAKNWNREKMRCWCKCVCVERERERERVCVCVCVCVSVWERERLAVCLCVNVWQKNNNYEVKKDANHSLTQVHHVLTVGIMKDVKKWCFNLILNICSQLIMH